VTRVRGNSQNARILRALAGGRWVTTSELYRRCGGMVLHSRVSELRGYGYELEHDTVPGRVGALGHRYRLLGNPEIPEVVTQHPPGVVLARDEVPRDPDHRFRIYRMIYDELELVGTAATAIGVGSEFIRLGRDGVFSGSCAGLLDTHGTDDASGTWLISPWDTTP